MTTMPTRFAPLSDQDMTPEQKRVARALASGPRAGLRGPFHALLRSPELADRVRRLGDFVRFESTFPAPLRELAILLVARFWSAHYEWNAHRKHAISAGLGPAIAAAIETGQRPAMLSEDEAIVYDLISELLVDKDISDATYRAAESRFGERAIVELIGTAGYYGIVSLVLNAARTPVPDGGTRLPALAPIAIDSRIAEVNGTRLHYLIAGRGDAVLLLHGYAQTSHMWRPLIAELAKSRTVIAPDLRGFGDSARPDGGYDKKTMAQDVHALAASLGHRRIAVVGHDIGLMVAYAYAAQHPTEVERIVLMDAFLPGVGDWKSVWLLRDMWHFHFYGRTPLELVAGRERIYFEHFWNEFAADPSRSVCEADRRFYAAAYAQPGAMKAGFEVFRAFEQDARDFAGFAAAPLTMPMLVLAGEKALGEFLVQQGRLVDDNVEGVVIAGAGHWLVDEAPDQVIPRLVAFLTPRTVDADK
jgi:pimeloyl-ACP methyl ester carboxylesterase/alkylhydroperoxidase family enzyme